MVTVKATYSQVYDNGDFDPKEIREAIIHKIKKEMVDAVKDNSLTKDDFYYEIQDDKDVLSSKNRTSKTITYPKLTLKDFFKLYKSSRENEIFKISSNTYNFNNKSYTKIELVNNLNFCDLNVIGFSTDLDNHMQIFLN